MSYFGAALQLALRNFLEESLQLTLPPLEFSGGGLSGCAPEHFKGAVLHYLRSRYCFANVLLNCSEERQSQPCSNRRFHNLEKAGTELLKKVNPPWERRSQN